MGRRRRNDDFGGLIGLIAVILVLFGAAIVAFLKALLLVLLIGGGAVLGGFLLYRLGRNLWVRQMDIEGYLPSIDWTVPAIPSFDSAWVDIRYPDVSSPAHCAPAPHVIGTSGAWKAVLVSLERFPTLRGSSDPRDLQYRVSACEAAVTDILRQACASAEELARQKQPELEQQVKRLQEAESTLERRTRPRLETLQYTIEALAEGHFLDRLRADRLRSHLSEYEIELSNRRRQARERARQQEQAIRSFLDPGQRERALEGRIQRDLAAMNEVIKSKDFAGAAAEVAVIEELTSLSRSLVFNDVKMESGRYIHFQGKPLMSAQIDTLAITPTGVFVIEVKNWSREFARSGEGFSPFEQASRASYLVFDRLRSAGIGVKVRAIIATKGSLPDRGDSKVAVVPIGRLRRYIEGGPGAMMVDVSAVRSALGL